MKNSICFLMTLLVSVILCGCSNIGNDASVVGTWKMDMEDGMKEVEESGKGKMLDGSTCEYVFNEDGTGEEKGLLIIEQNVTEAEGVKFKTTIKMSNPFKWHKDGSKLVIEIIDINQVWDREAICDNPKNMAKWQKEAKEPIDRLNRDYSSVEVRNEAVRIANAEGGYDFEILELSESKLELKSAKGDIKKFDKVK